MAKKSPIVGRVRVRRRPDVTRPSISPDANTQEPQCGSDDGSASESDYDVGYGKPPKNTRFQKGQSGNPKGRPKTAKNYKTLVQRELDAPVFIRRDGQVRQVSTRLALVLRLKSKALDGDLKALTVLMALDDELAAAAKDASRSDTSNTLSDPEQRAILDEMVRRATDGAVNTVPNRRPKPTRKSKKSK